MVECLAPSLEVVGSNPAVRSIKKGNVLEEITFWEAMRKGINSFKDGQLVTRKQLISKIAEFYPEEVSEGSFDIYRLTLTKINILQHVSRGKYKIVQEFPENLSSSKALKLEIELRWRPSWKDWFYNNVKDRIRNM